MKVWYTYNACPSFSSSRPYCISLTCFSWFHSRCCSCYNSCCSDVYLPLRSISHERNLIIAFLLSRALSLWRMSRWLYSSAALTTYTGRISSLTIGVCWVFIHSLVGHYTDTAYVYRRLWSGQCSSSPLTVTGQIVSSCMKSWRAHNHCRWPLFRDDWVHLGLVLSNGVINLMNQRSAGEVLLEAVRVKCCVMKRQWGIAKFRSIKLAGILWHPDHIRCFLIFFNITLSAKGAQNGVLSLIWTTLLLFGMHLYFKLKMLVNFFLSVERTQKAGAIVVYVGYVIRLNGFPVMVKSIVFECCSWSGLEI